MTHEEAIKAIQREIECVKRQGKTGECCRDELGCGACDLVFEDEWILEAYDMAIHALKTNKKMDEIGDVILDYVAGITHAENAIKKIDFIYNRGDDNETD